MTSPSVGIIGGGFVGGAVASGFCLYADVKVYDIDKGKRTHTFEEVVEQDIIFVCLPSPMCKDGSVDTSIVSTTLALISDKIPSYKPVVLKSTVPPEDLNRWSLTWAKDFKLVFNPEFLTERTAKLDFQQANRIIFGIERGNLQLTTHDNMQVDVGLNGLDALFRKRFPGVPFYWTSYTAAALVKYFTNTFFCTKISLFNEFAQICEQLDVPYDKVIEMVLMDYRIGRSHWMVPGTDGKKGFGGSCFLKDINGYMKIAESTGVYPSMGEATWKVNLQWRGIETVADELTAMYGRASSEKVSAAELRKIRPERKD